MNFFPDCSATDAKFKHGTLQEGIARQARAGCELISNTAIAINNGHDLVNPRSLIHALYVHWDIIESLVVVGRDFPSFDQVQMIEVITRRMPGKRIDECESAMRQMVSSDLLQVMPRGSSLQINPLVQDFVRGLTREHDLGLSAVLKARVDAIKGATSKLAEGLQLRDSDQLRQAAAQLSELFRQISQQLDQDRHAILELTERAKSKDANLPIGRRYREVLAAFDDYVAPMAEMMDSGPLGTFYRHLEDAEHALDHALDTLTVQGALYTQRLSMRQVAFQAKELRRLGREVLKHCSDTLLPLREEIRQHNVLSTAISQLLGRVRKRGLNATLGAVDLPLWHRDMPRRVTVGDEVLTIMGDALNFQPDTVSFPEDLIAADMVALELVDESAIVRALHQDLPIGDLLCWLHDHHPDLSDATVLRLYHMLIEREEWTVKAEDLAVVQRLNTVRVIYFPHALTPTATV